MNLKIGKFIEIPNTEDIIFDIEKEEVTINGQTEISIPLNKLISIEMNKPITPVLIKSKPEITKLRLKFILPSVCVVKKQCYDEKCLFSIKCE